MKNQQAKTQKKKSNKKLWIILAVVAVIVIAVIAIVIRGFKKMAEQLSAVMTDSVAEAQLGEIAVNTEGIGVVEAVSTENVYADYTVTLRRLYKQNGQRVEAGEVIAEFDGLTLDESVTALESQLAQADAQLAAVERSGATTVTSPVAGRVKKLLAAKDDSVLAVQSRQGALAVISADGNLKVEFEPQAEPTLGQRVKILWGDTVVDGTINEVSRKRATAVFPDSKDYALDQEATVQAEDGTVLGTGITACGHAVYVTGDSGSIAEVSVKEQEEVSAKSTLFKLKDVSYSVEYLALLEQREQLADRLAKAKEYKNGYIVVAAKDSIIKDLNAGEGDTLPAGTLLCRLLSTEAYQVVLDIDELDIQGIAEGQQVEVTVDAIRDAVYQGTVSNVSMIGENLGGVGTYKVCVLLETAENLLPGMSANGKITISRKTDARLVPIDALKTIDGQKTVTVVKEDGTYEDREVEVGLVNNEYAEILSGVQAGEKLQVVMKLKDFYSQMGLSIEEAE